ncbi:hypothetical protein NLG97_g2972 [Lecanicillium saksenae]|uniref:Uncharacterized protein n=1 Tax=Lecanicillium saksenae TaxID=468837 RepID=A0ACC1R1B1_9HYPO|nr:hypothetical protein NLG97_g2972 [Lecanicillium saksenae]
MDLFAKAVKSGIAKGYAVGQQQIQQHLSKQRDSGTEASYGNQSGYYGAQQSSDVGASQYPQPQPHHQQYPPVYNGHAPPLPPRQYQPPQPQSDYNTYTPPHNPPGSYDSAITSRPDYSYSSILPPPPPSYIPPTSAAATTNAHNGAPPTLQHQNVAGYDQNYVPRYENLQYQSPSPYDITAGNRPVRTPITSAIETNPGPQQQLVRDGNGGFILVDIPSQDPQNQHQRPVESYSYAVQPATNPSYRDTEGNVPYERTTYTQPPTDMRESNEPNPDTSRKPSGGKSGILSFVENSMSALNLGPTAKIGLPEPEPRVSIKPRKRVELPAIVADGPGREVIRFCPENRLVDYPLYWHYLDDLPDSSICTRCFADHIEATPLASKFNRKLAAPDTVLSCHFHYYRVKNVLWPAAVKTGNLDALKAFLSSRLQIPNCKDREATTGPDGIKYYGMKDDNISGFIACEACFVDRIAGAPFEPQFVPYKVEQGKTDRWICDASIPYIRKALELFSERNDWTGFIEGTTRRCKLLICAGNEMARADCENWYTTKQQMEGFQVCETCYMDKIELDPFNKEFEKLPASADYDQYIEFLRQRWSCSLTSSSLPMMFALEAAENMDDFSAFHKSASAIVKLVPCTKNGIIRGNWWTLAGGCKNFDICEACYEGIMKPNELDKFLETKKHGSEETIVCDFCPAAPRYNEYLSKFAETLDRGVFSCYADHVKTFASVPACPGRDHLAKSHWWGYGEALFCQNCYLVYVRHTSLSDHMPLQGEYDERAQICQIWSPRMRNMWRAVCDAGEPGSAESNAELIKFRAFGAKRLEVYLVTVPKINFIKGMKEIKMMQAMQQGQLSLMYQGMNSMAVLSGTDDGNWHGNSSIGWYETENGATGAQMFNNMQAGMADANRGDEWMQIFQLELMWKEVE